MYKLSEAGSLHDVATGLLIPLYSRLDRNAFFVHIANRKNIITEFVPHYDLDEFVRHEIEQPFSVSTGEPAPLAFRIDRRVIVCKSSDELRLWLDVNRAVLADHPLLRSQLNRVCGMTLGGLYLDWEKASKTVFKLDSNARNWISNETALFQKNDAIWELAESKAKPTSNKYGKTELKYLELDQSELMTYILNPRNYDANGWDEVWLHCESQFGFDDVLFDAGYTWIGYTYATYHEEVYRYYVLLSRLIQYQYLKFERHQQFKDFLAEVFCEDLPEAVEAGFPFHFHKMAIELAQDDMGMDSQLEFLEASLFFFNSQEYPRLFFIDRLLALLESAKRDSFSKEMREIIEILKSLRSQDAVRGVRIQKLLKKFTLE